MDTNQIFGTNLSEGIVVAENGMRLIFAEEERKKKITTGVCVVVLLLLSVFTTYKSVFYGCDIDESYAITMSYRMVMGDWLFGEMWELHQTSAVFMAPFIYLYRIIHGNTLGIVVFLRLVGCVIQLGIAGLLWHSFSKYVSSMKALLLAALFYNFSPKYLQVLEFCFLEYLFMMCFFVSLLYYIHYKKNFFLITCGLSIAGMVLAYPQTVVLFPVICIGIYFVLRNYEGKSIRKVLAVICGTTVLCGIAYIGVILYRTKLSELVQNLPFILADDSHKQSIVVKMQLLMKEIVEFFALPIVLAVLCEVIGHFYEKSKGKRLAHIEVIYLILVALTPIYYIVTLPGIKHVDLAYVIYPMFIALGYVNRKQSKSIDHKNAICILQFLGVLIFIAAQFGSNMTMYANSGMLMPVVILQMLLYFMSTEKEMCQVSFRKQFLKFCPILVMCLYFFVARSVLVRFTSVQPLTIFEDYYEIGIGTAEKVKVTEFEHIQYHAKLSAIQKYVTHEDTLLYLGSDMYNYFMIGNGIGVQSTISTPGFDETAVAYYERYPEKMPDIVVLDKYHTTLERAMENEAFAEWLGCNYDLENVIEEEMMTVIYRK